MVMGVTPAQAGLAAARVRGRTGGRKPKLTPKLIDKAQRMYDARQFTMAEIAQSCARGHTIEAPIPGDLRTSQKFQRHAPQTVGPISYPSRQSSAPIRGQTGARSSLALMAAQITASSRRGRATAAGGTGLHGDADRVRQPTAGAEPGPHDGGGPGDHGQGVRRLREHLPVAVDAGDGR